ncbi:hypothetical protein GCM10022419_046840 [Nonomuraea rosea]|uniref:Uncharacterized protein n=1 Tax=Nonomuraea rosea TaxID=638574 RepID=A0ABP6X7J2_9ACTN
MQIPPQRTLLHEPDRRTAGERHPPIGGQVLAAVQAGTEAVPADVPGRPDRDDLQDYLKFCC